MLSKLFALEKLVATVIKDDILVLCYQPTFLGNLQGLKPRKAVKLLSTGFGPWEANGDAMCTNVEYPLNASLELNNPGIRRLVFGGSWRSNEHTMSVSTYGFGDPESITYRITSFGMVALMGVDYGDLTPDKAAAA